MDLKAEKMLTPISKVGALIDPEREEGFTLIELILVIAVISVVAVIVLPRLDPFLPKRRLKSAVRVLSGTISLAYGEAVAKNKTYRLYFDAPEDRYWITEVSTSQKDEERGGAPGIRLGTHFELLQDEDGIENIEENMPTEPMLSPKSLPDGVHFSSVEIYRNMTMTTPDIPYIEFGPLGNASPATIILMNDDDEQFVIQYDGVTGIPMIASANDLTG